MNEHHIRPIDVLNGWSDIDAGYRRWTLAEVKCLRRAVCVYGESTAEGWFAVRKVMDRDCRFDGQGHSWSLRVSSYSVERPCSFTDYIPSLLFIVRCLNTDGSSKPHV
jgi:hypothetical protein